MAVPSVPGGRVVKALEQHGFVVGPSCFRWYN